MLTTDGAPQRARWEVVWLKDGRLIRKDFGSDLSEAVRISGKLIVAGRKAVTVRCKNMGFPPPDKFADREQVIVTKNGRRFRGMKLIEPRVYVKKMSVINHRGVWWCPYCMKMRRFVQLHGGIWKHYFAMGCPVCGISHQDTHVRRYNPMAGRIAYSDGPTGRKKRGK